VSDGVLTKNKVKITLKNNNNVLWWSPPQTKIDIFSVGGCLLVFFSGIHPLLHSFFLLLEQKYNACVLK